MEERKDRCDRGSGKLIEDICKKLGWVGALCFPYTFNQTFQPWVN